MKKRILSKRNKNSNFLFRNDLRRELLYSNIRISKNFQKEDISAKFLKVKSHLNFNIKKSNNENINFFLKNLYKLNGFDHFSNTKSKSRKYEKYKNNVDFELIEEIMESDTMKRKTLKDIQIEYNKSHFNAKISISKLYSHIKQLGYRYKKLNTINRKVLTNCSINTQKSVINLLLDKIIDGNMVFYVDECPMSKNIKKNRGFIKKSIKINNAIGNERIKRTTLLYIIGNNGMFYYNLTSEIVTARVFWTFIQSAIKFFKGSSDFTEKLSQKKVLIFMDNAAIHYKREERAQNVDENIWILYNVPYCCHLNPIEYCFSYLKNHIKKQSIKTQNDLIDKSMEYLDENAQEDIKNAIKYAIKIWENMFN